MNNAIQVQNLNKSFLLPHEQRNTLKESFINLFRRTQYEHFQALNNVAFSIPKGSFFGIMGANGSGKSTLLKILANIYQPDSGEVLVSGKVAPLLELGIGFQQELPARQNIFINAALLGLTNRQIEKALPKIIEFAEIENFIDLKIKNFSSGMRQRLAFAIATQIEADIYLCDEVLAVGDESFQRKCLQKFAQWQQEGKTIVLVSHNVNQIQQFCDQAIWLHLGEIEAQGRPAEVVEAYLGHLYRQNQPDFSDSPVRITKLTIHEQSPPKTPKNTFSTHQPITIQIHYHTKEPLTNPVFGLALHKHDGTHLTGPNTQTSQYSIPLISGSGYLECQFVTQNLLAGTYLLSASIFNHDCTHPFDYLDKQFSFSIIESQANQYGLIDLSPKWNIVESRTEQ